MSQTNHGDSDCSSLGASHHSLVGGLMWFVHLAKHLVKLPRTFQALRILVNGRSLGARHDLCMAPWRVEGRGAMGCPGELGALETLLANAEEFLRPGGQGWDEMWLRHNVSCGYVAMTMCWATVSFKNVPDISRKNILERNVQNSLNVGDRHRGALAADRCVYVRWGEGNLL